MGRCSYLGNSGGMRRGSVWAGPFLGKWRLRSVGCGVQKHPGSSSVATSEAVLGEMLLRSQVWCANQGQEPCRRFWKRFWKAHLVLKVLLCFRLAQLAQTIRRERISQIKHPLTAEALLVCSDLLPLPCGPVPRAAIPGLLVP